MYIHAVVDTNQSIHTLEYTMHLFTDMNDAYKYVKMAQEDGQFLHVFGISVDAEEDIRFLKNPSGIWIAHARCSPGYDDRHSFGANEFIPDRDDFYTNPENWVDGICPAVGVIAQGSFSNRWRGADIELTTLVRAETKEEATEIGEGLMESYLEQLRCERLQFLADDFQRRIKQPWFPTDEELRGS